MTDTSKSNQPYQAVITDPDTGLATVQTFVWDSEVQAREWACSLAHTRRVHLWHNEKMIGSCAPPLGGHDTAPIRILTAGGSPRRTEGLCQRTTRP
jgi:hypothetical protein